LSSGGLAVVGSRHVDDDLVQYTQAVGALAAQSSRAIVSGGAKGIDQAAMHGALDAGGRAVGILADSLEKSVLARYNRDMLLSKQLTLVSPYDPAAGFNVGNAMRRNKFIYALSNAALVVSSDVDKGGTWNGAVEQLAKLKLVPVYVRSTGPESAGLKALVGKGARCWPNPAGVDGFRALLKSTADAVEDAQPGLPFSEAVAGNGDEYGELPISRPAAAITSGATADEIANHLQDRLFDTVRTLIRDLAVDPTHVPDVATALAVTEKQAALWIARLLEEHVLVKGPGENSFIASARP
jgi:predicted Rossmann fold nucleotide-binding protein DprA/Smf involved in DNA uptake